MSALDEALVRLDSDGKPREPSACAIVAKEVFERYGALPTPAEQEEAFRVRVRNRIESLYLSGVHAELRSFRTEWVWSGAGAFCPDEYEKADRVAREDGWLFGTVCPTSEYLGDALPPDSAFYDGIALAYQLLLDADLLSPDFPLLPRPLLPRAPATQTAAGTPTTKNEADLP
jgi:hypothetical protein